jgi:hypothetical protein
LFSFNKTVAGFFFIGNYSTIESSFIQRKMHGPLMGTGVPAIMVTLVGLATVMLIIGSFGLAIVVVIIASLGFTVVVLITSTIN